MPAVEIILPSLISDSFYYSVPNHLTGGAQVGKRAAVPLGNRRTIGFIVGFPTPPKGLKLRDIVDVIDDEPLFDARRLEFFKWIARYCVCPLGAVLKAAHPSGLGSMSMKKTAALTSEGMKAMSSREISGSEKTLLRALQSGPADFEKLFEIAEGSGFGTAYSLARRGFLKIDYEAKRTANILYETFYSAVAGSSERSEISTMPAKRSIVEFIEERTATRASDIKNIFAGASAHLKWLEKKAIVTAEKKEVVRDPFAEIRAEKSPPPKLSPEQLRAFSEISRAIAAGKFAPFLLHGVTGSGKTEVYLRAIEEVRKTGRQCLVMTPEISLTPQLVQRFRSRFGDAAAVMHSLLSEGQRFDSWRRARSGEAEIVIGARSAIFAPFSNLGLIVVDEEHEKSYKQEELQPCYNARDLALVLGRMEGCPVILGSATPSLESYANAVSGKFRYLSMPLRIEGSALPQVELVREEKAVFSRALKKSLIENYKSGGKAIVFLNRRGFSTALICGTCGDLLSCPNCSVSLTYHKRGNSIKCHYCGMDEKFSGACPKCGGRLRQAGVGTQAVEEEAQKILPSATVARMDSDASGAKKTLIELYGKLERGEIDVLVGTQMVAKGHDLPGVTLVGVISADTALSMPDFRSGETVFQTLTQAAGRAGRGRSAGRVLIQTANPRHPSIKYAVSQDAAAFLKSEMEVRKITGWPPFSRVAALRFSGSDENRVKRAAELIHSLAIETAAGMKRGKVEVVGHSECPIYRIRNRFRRHIIMRSQSPSLLCGLSKALKDEAEKIMPPKTRMLADIDPVSFL